MVTQEQISTARIEHLHVHAVRHHHPLPHVHRFPPVVFSLGTVRTRRASQASVKHVLNTEVTTK